MDVKKYVAFQGKIVIIGFGSIARGVLPLILSHLSITPEQITIINKSDEGETTARKFGVHFKKIAITPTNYNDVLKKYLSPNDFLLNLSIDVASLALIQFCQANNILYLDTCIEPWAGGYLDPSLPPATRSNYALRESVLALKTNSRNKATALVAHGANPGLISHFVKQALLNLAADNGLQIQTPQTKIAWAELSYVLGIKTIHVAETDSQIADTPKQSDEFVNTWSVEGFIAEGMQPAELGWGSHEKHWPADAKQHQQGCQSAIYLERPGAATKVRSWTPLAGTYHGFLITHNESISMADYFSIKKDGIVCYRPTVHYAYRPCEDALLSIHELAGREWQMQNKLRLLSDDIIEGVDELGVLLMGNSKGAYWFGSHLSISEARALAPYNNATSLQVAIGVLAGMIWVMKNPCGGIREPEEIDFNLVMDIALPYLGKVAGYYSDWTPLRDRGKLFPENIDPSDPWQFVNIRVN